MPSHPAALVPSTGLPRPARTARWLPVLLWALILGTGALSAGESRIELRDGSVISGEVVGVGPSGYRIRSPTLGEIQVRESNVLAIRPATAAGAAAPSPGAAAGGQAANLAAIQQQLLSNPQTMDAITRLQSDPGIAAALADPELARLILSGDVETLRADPRFQRLMENPEIQAIVGQVLGH